MKESCGFTLIELLVTLSISATLIALAAPSVAGLVQSGNVASAVNAFMGDLRFARGEAARRGTPVIVCRSDSPESSTPACSSAPSGQAENWISGWLVFEDRDNNGSFGAGDKILRVQAPISAFNQINSSANQFSFTPMGRQWHNPANATFGAELPTARQRLVCIGATGRARIANGTSC